MKGPWRVGGVFNSMLSLEDTGGRSNLAYDVRSFIEYMRTSGSKGLGFKGQAFTLMTGGIKRRLDSALENLDRLNRFRKVSVIHLPKLKSDHVPILLKFGNQGGNSHANRSFRLLVSWFFHDNFSNLMKKSWLKEKDLLSNI